MSEQQSGIIGRFVQLVAWLLEWIVIGLVGSLVLVVLWGVVTRGLSWIAPQHIAPSRWTEEAAEILLMWVALLGAAVAFRRRVHLGVDYLEGKLDPRAARLLQGIVLLVSTAFAGAALVYGGYVLVSEALASGQVTPALGLRKGCVYLVAPISGVLIVLFCLYQTVQLWSVWPEPAASEPPAEQGD